MSNQNQKPGQQNQNPGQKPGQQQQGGGQKPGQQQQDPVRMRDPARTPIWIASFERSERYGRPRRKAGLFVCDGRATRAIKVNKWFKLPLQV